MISGILGIYKPSGITSFDVIRIIKKQTGISKIGHGGTLDPMASGVLPILINDSTAFFDPLLHSSKKYYTIIQLGQTTDTDDKDGQILENYLVPEISLEQINQKISLLTGLISQIPPQYSALKVDGKRAYDLAREGKKVELKARDVMVYSWENVSYDPILKQISALVHCGSGTYIRSLARDLASLLGIGGHLIFLQRTMSGGINIEDTINIDFYVKQYTKKTMVEKKFPEEWLKKLISPEIAISFLPAVEWLGDIDYLIHGKPLISKYYDAPPLQKGLYRLMYQEKIIALLLSDGSKLYYQKNFSKNFTF
ncbi:MAG: tRNA pseudouridine(55) synthase TruB [Brevinema sp.]